MKRMLSLLLTLLLLPAAQAAESYPLTLFAINVGKGDALLLNAGNETYLIDAGTQEHWGDVSRALKTLHVSHLTGVILTHTDKDHAGGLLPLATSSITVEKWYASWAYTGKEKNHPAVEAADLRGQDVVWLHPGDELPLGSGKLTVLGPINKTDEENDNSLVLLAEGGGGKILLAGDMELPEERDLLLAGVIPPCDVLKVPNHGDNDATSAELVQLVSPQAAIISTSTAEKTDTPSNRVIRLLKNTGAKVYETQDATSGILVTLDEGKVEANAMHYGNLPDAESSIRIHSVDNEDDRITLINSGKKAVDVSGWYIVSERGNQIFVLPEGTVMIPDGTLVISSYSSERQGSLVWPDKKVWHKSKDDAAVLYDVYGREMDRAE